MIKQILRDEGVRGFYKGLSASYLCVTEGTIQWVLYDRLKKLTAGTQRKGGVQEWVGMIGSAGTAKCFASLITYPDDTYPHEVIPLLLLRPVRAEADGPLGRFCEHDCETTCGWKGQVHWSLANITPRHRRRRRGVVIRWSKCPPYACHPERCSYVLHLRGGIAHVMTPRSDCPCPRLMVVRPWLLLYALPHAIDYALSML